MPFPSRTEASNTKPHLTCCRVPLSGPEHRGSSGVPTTPRGSPTSLQHSSDAGFPSVTRSPLWPFCKIRWTTQTRLLKLKKKKLQWGKKNFKRGEKKIKKGGFFVSWKAKPSTYSGFPRACWIPRSWESCEEAEGGSGGSAGQAQHRTLG